MMDQVSDWSVTCQYFYGRNDLPGVGRGADRAAHSALQGNSEHLVSACKNTLRATSDGK